MTKIAFELRVLCREMTRVLRGLEGLHEEWDIVARADLALRVAECSLVDLVRRRKLAGVKVLGQGQGLARRASGRGCRRFPK